MSLWDTYFAPGDLRRRQQLEAAPPLSTPDQDAATKAANDRLDAPPQRINAAHRQRRQDALLYGGVLFTLLSLLITRRSLQRKKLPFPKTFEASNAPPPKSDGAMDAAEALGLATLSTLSIAMLAAGAGSKWFDIADIEDLRDGVRRGVGFDVYGGDSEADKEMEGWIADVLSRKDGEGGLKESIASKLKELEDIEKRKGEKR
ncbi:hypothetical protein B0A55_08072 [Friedmanniomyces simplex]|uniref:Altered inheritance of mitochondria protein 11 n=1 Tax=Friedmanniomyces simplex TaxID=329884 RepID=A0A4V5NF93_9PEZI|nr:hypothetical protein B0A55_08072 [Friedmanniomyces simplex]